MGASGAVCNLMPGGRWSDISVLQLPFIFITILLAPQKGGEACEEHTCNEVAPIGWNQGGDGGEDHACQK